ncbi:acyl carrier protein [Congzhengia sp.]|uniref:acyl carrier protein n=1 Tax=Congzhengia sp. TaxID=2944168 RepID=UPI003077E3FD
MMNTLEKLIEKIEQILSEHGIYVKIKQDSKLIQEYPIDSIIAIEILINVEETFGIDIDDDELSLELLDTPTVLSEYIERKLTNK